VRSYVGGKATTTTTTTIPTTTTTDNNNSKIALGKKNSFKEKKYLCRQGKANVSTTRRTEKKSRKC